MLSSQRWFKERSFRASAILWLCHSKASASSSRWQPWERVEILWGRFSWTRLESAMGHFCPCVTWSELTSRARWFGGTRMWSTRLGSCSQLSIPVQHRGWAQVSAPLKCGKIAIILPFYSGESGLLRAALVVIKASSRVWNLAPVLTRYMKIGSCLYLRKPRFLPL